jgi:hypothetical protein
MDAIGGFFRFWYDFIIGDAWEIAAGIVVVLGLGAVLVSTGAVPREAVPPLVGAGIVLVVAGSVWAEARRRSRA